MKIIQLLIADRTILDFSSYLANRVAA